MLNSLSLVLQHQAHIRKPLKVNVELTEVLLNVIAQEIMKRMYMPKLKREKRTHPLSHTELQWALSQLKGILQWHDSLLFSESQTSTVVHIVPLFLPPFVISFLGTQDFSKLDFMEKGANKSRMWENGEVCQRELL